MIFLKFFSFLSSNSFFVFMLFSFFKKTFEFKQKFRNNNVRKQDRVIDIIYRQRSCIQIFYIDVFDHHRIRISFFENLFSIIFFIFIFFVNFSSTFIVFLLFLFLSFFICCSAVALNN